MILFVILFILSLCFTVYMGRASWVANDEGGTGAIKGVMLKASLTIAGALMSLLFAIVLLRQLFFVG